jgi:alpha-tubulin suppressor-like RCC1 family protein
MHKSLPYFVGFALLSSCRGEPTSPADAPASRPSLATTAATLPFAQVSAGYAHSCGVTTGGLVFCWGNNGAGQLGDGTIERRVLPTPIAGGLLFRQVSAGVSHTCGVTTNYQAYCWGRNSAGQVGDGTNISLRLIPVPVAGDRAFRQISAGGKHTCALTTSTTSKIYCWGEGILGNGSGYATFKTPQLVSGARTYRQVSVGTGHTCAVSTTHKVLCWGGNRYGQLGNGGAASFIAVSPVAVAGTVQYLQVSAGVNSTCAVTTTNKAYCWGYGFHGQIGDGKWLDRFTPRAVAGGLSFERVSAGKDHTCGETAGNRAYCWGANWWGELGDGTFENERPTPTAVVGELHFAQVDAGASHNCGVATGYQAWCWGKNMDGQLGNGTYSNLYTEPYPVQY